MQTRKTAHRRGYDRQWRKASKAYLAKHPWCANHLINGHRVLANVVDHIKPHKGDMKLFWDSSNWQSLCYHCHNSVKQSRERGGQGLLKGCDVDGMPLDASHHWHKGGGVKS